MDNLVRIVLDAFSPGAREDWTKQEIVNEVVASENPSAGVDGEFTKNLGPAEGGLLHKNVPEAAIKGPISSKKAPK